MTIKLAERLSAVKPSPTLAITARAAEMRAAGKDIIGLGAGEPDFDTPNHIKQAAIKALDNGFTKYTAVDGTAGLKSAIIDKFKNDNGLSYEADQILVSVGGKQSFYNLAQALLGPGDEVIIPAPYWVSYPDMVLLAGAKPIIINTDQSTNLKITPEQLRAAISDHTKLFVINSPSNPSGLAYSLEELKGLAEVLLDYPNIVIATDDMYEHILWDSKFCNILNACPELYDRTVTLNGVSKAYSMTGWRIGYAGGPKEVIQAMKKIQSQSTSNPTSISQVAAEAALRGDQSCVASMVKEFRIRHDRVVELLNEIPGCTCTATDGTFYVFPNFQQTISIMGLKDDLALSERFIEGGVALVPGSAFGSPGYARISIATSMDNLETALQRMKTMVMEKSGQ